MLLRVVWNDITSEITAEERMLRTCHVFARKVPTCFKLCFRHFRHNSGITTPPDQKAYRNCQM